MPTHAGWKGKTRAVDINNRDEGMGGISGIVLSLDNGGSDVIYTLPVKVGATNQQFSLQVDTGSSDLWIASTSCSTSICNSAHGHLYDPSAAAATGANFSISYLSGSAAGPIVWDSVTIGGYTIDNQALAAVNNVQSEPLAPDFSGILGIALPLNSIIAIDVPQVTSNSRDGTPWTSNLFSINTAPSFHFLSLALSRPGSNHVQSVLGIGEHPTALVPDPSLIQYSRPVIDASGALFWKATVRAITVYVDGVAKQVQLGTSNTGTTFLDAVLDSGTPLIFTTTTIANAIYGAIGIAPAADGMYYFPCKTPLNMTITLDNRSPTPLHPLDLTIEPSLGNSPHFCTGLIQTADAQLSNSDSKADIVLGVPFMRNVYTVMAYSVPNSNGSFTAVNNTDQKDGGLPQTITPMLGLMSLTDPKKALQEFHNVRVLNQPMDGSNTSSRGAPSNVGEKKISAGIIVLIGLLSFLGLCGVLFASRWFLIRRAQRKTVARQSTDDDKVAYMLTRTSPSKRERAVGTDSRDIFSEDELRKMRFETYLRKEERKNSSLSTMSSGRTRVANYEGTKYGRVYDDSEGMEFGQLGPTRKTTVDEDLVWDAETGLDWGDNTLTQHPPRACEIPPEPPEPPGLVHLPSEYQNFTASHRRNSSLALQPLLTSQPENDLDVENYEGYTQPNNPHHPIITNSDT